MPHETNWAWCAARSLEIISASNAGHATMSPEKCFARRDAHQTAAAQEWALRSDRLCGIGRQMAVAGILDTRASTLAHAESNPTRLRFRWCSPELKQWLEQRIVGENNRRVGRVY